MSQIVETPKPETAGHGNAIQAVAAAMADVKRVAKDNRNVEQKYDFASIDDFIAMVGPICAKHGLVTVIDEDNVDFIEKAGKYGPTQWAKITYQVTTHHTSGDKLPTVRRHVEVIRSGPQAYGSAQSYTLKQYYRGLLNIPTGEKDDPDFGAQQVQEQASARQAEQPKPQPRDPRQVANSLIDVIRKTNNAADLADQNTEGRKFADAWQWLEDEHSALAAEVKAAFDARMNALRPVDQTEIPY